MCLVVWTECSGSFSVCEKDKVCSPYALAAHHILAKVRVCKKLVHTLEDFHKYWHLRISPPYHSAATAEACSVVVNKIVHLCKRQKMLMLPSCT